MYRAAQLSLLVAPLVHFQCGGDSKSVCVVKDVALTLVDQDGNFIEDPAACGTGFKPTAQPVPASSCKQAQGGSSGEGSLRAGSAESPVAAPVAVCEKSEADVVK